MTRYARHLTAALRGRGAGEGRIADVLREVEGLGLSDAQLRDELGDPKQYAAAVAPGPGRGVRLTDLLVPLGVVAALAWVVLVLWGQARGWELAENLGPLRLLPAVLLGWGGFAAQRLLDLWRPVAR